MLTSTKSLFFEFLLSCYYCTTYDCVVAMAEYIAGSENAFVDMMNAKAKELGMNDTCFKNCHGIDEDNHVTSSYDIALMSKELLTKYPEIIKYTTIWNDTLRDGRSSLVNTNKLVHNYSGATGLKTGSTSLALFNLSASATRDDLSLIAVVMKAPTSNIRFNNAKQLLDYGFNTYSYKKLASSGEIIKSISVKKGIEDTVEVSTEKDIQILLPKGQYSAIEQKINIEEKISAPIAKGQIVGSISFCLNGQTIDSGNLIANNSVSKIGLLSMSRHIYEKWFYLLR